VGWVGGRGGVTSYGHCTSSLIRIKRRGGGVSSWGLLFISVHKSVAYRLPHKERYRLPHKERGGREGGGWVGLGWGGGVPGQFRRTL
jgi:hypothetical protein